MTNACQLFREISLSSVSGANTCSNSDSIKRHRVADWGNQAGRTGRSPGRERAARESAAPCSWPQGMGTGNPNKSLQPGNVSGQVTDRPVLTTLVLTSENTLAPRTVEEVDVSGELRVTKGPEPLLSGLRTRLFIGTHTRTRPLPVHGGAHRDEAGEGSGRW